MHPLMGVPLLAHGVEVQGHNLHTVTEHDSAFLKELKRTPDRRGSSHEWHDCTDTVGHSVFN